MQKNKRYYIGKFLNFIKNKIPKLYKKLSGDKGFRKIILDSLIKYHINIRDNLVEEVKGNKKSKETIKPKITKE